MTNSMILKSIIERLQASSPLSAFKIKVFNHVPAEQSPPYFEVKVVSFTKAIGQQTSSAIVELRAVSAYPGDAELETLVSSALYELTDYQPFKTVDQSALMQGRLLNRERKTSADGRTRTEQLQLIFFLSMCN